MDLREYLFRKNMKISRFAREIGYSREHIEKLIRGQSYASVRLARTIQEATAGEVTVLELTNPKKTEIN
jgi:hypothetical protein